MAGSGTGGDPPLNPNFKRIFVGGLAPTTREDSMVLFFKRFGEILDIAVILDKTTGNSRGFGFVQFKDHRAAVRACQYPLSIIDGKRIVCTEALPHVVLSPRRSNSANRRHLLHGQEHYPPTTLSPNLMQEEEDPNETMQPALHQNPTGYNQSMIRHGYPNIMNLRLLPLRLNPISHPYYQMHQQPSQFHGSFAMQHPHQAGFSSGGGLQLWRGSAVQVRASYHVLGFSAFSTPVIYRPQPTGGNQSSNFLDRQSGSISDENADLVLNQQYGEQTWS